MNLEDYYNEIANNYNKKNNITDEKEFRSVCIELLQLFYKTIYHNSISANDIHFVWQCKILQNFKSLVSTTVNDGMYYELTYDGDKNQIYFDAYAKLVNAKIKLE